MIDPASLSPWLLFVAPLAVVAAYIVFGLSSFGATVITATIFIGMALLAPFAWLGLKIGQRIHVGLTQVQMRRVIGAVLVASGASLLIRAFA